MLRLYTKLYLLCHPRSSASSGSSPKGEDTMLSHFDELSGTLFCQLYWVLYKFYKTG